MRLAVFPLFFAVCLAFANRLAVSKPAYCETVNIGVPYTLKWNAGESIPKVNIILRSGHAANLATEYTIARNIHNTGEYVWSAPADTRRSYPLTLMIQSADDPSVINFSSFFVVLDAGHWLSPSDFNTLVSNVSPKSVSSKEKAVNYGGSTSKVEKRNSSMSLLSTCCSVDGNQEHLVPSTIISMNTGSRYGKTLSNTALVSSKELSTLKKESTMPSSVNSLSKWHSQSTSSYKDDLKTNVSDQSSVHILTTHSAISTTQSTIESTENLLTPEKPRKTFKVTIKELNPNSTNSDEYSGNIHHVGEDYDGFLPSFFSDKIYGLLGSDGLSSPESRINFASATSIMSATSIVSDATLSSNDAIQREVPFQLLYLLFYLL